MKDIDGYVTKDDLYRLISHIKRNFDDATCHTIVNAISDMPSADVQPLSIVAEHIKNRLYETASNTTEAKARDAIADMAKRIDFWIDELKDGDSE